MELVPIKVRIGLKLDGSALYPDFNRCMSVKGAGIDWAYYIDAHGSGWLYDCCGHKESEADSPSGMQWGMLLVPANFATEAANAFPAVSILTESEAKTFYEEKHAREFGDEEIKEGIVTALKLKTDLNQPLSLRQQSALDPTTDTPGIRKNWRKTWPDFLARRGITIRP